MNRYDMWRIVMELVQETDLGSARPLHIRLIGTGELLCGEWELDVRRLTDMPQDRRQIPHDIHDTCAENIPE